MPKNQSNSQHDTSPAADMARAKWLSARESASKLGAKLFQPGCGYGNPEERMQDEQRLQTARQEAEQLFREYYDLDHHETEQKILRLQKSQHRATWASFAVAAIVGVATVIKTVVTLHLHK